jgi:hypothetical protein
MGWPKYIDIKVMPFENKIILTAGSDVRLRNGNTGKEAGYHKDVRFMRSGHYEYIGENTYQLKVDLTD